MKSNRKNILIKKTLNFLLLSVVVFSSFFGIVKNVQAESLKVNFPKESIIEHLKLNVPKSFKGAWLNAEATSWEPWLLKQDGFLGRQLFWDAKSEEAIILIGWKSRSAWKSIPQAEIDLVQDRFEKIAIKETGENEGNPFPLIYEGELKPQ